MTLCRTLLQKCYGIAREATVTRYSLLTCKFLPGGHSGRKVRVYGAFLQLRGQCTRDQDFLLIRECCYRNSPDAMATHFRSDVGLRDDSQCFQCPTMVGR